MTVTTTRHHRTAASRWTATIVVAALGLVGLGACSDDDSSSGSSGQPSPSVTQVPETSTTATVTSDPPPTTEAPPVDPNQVPSVQSVVAATVQIPTALVVRPGDDGHLWVAELAGRVRRLAVDDGGETLTPAGDPVLDISDQTTTDGERGLLGMAFSEDGSTLYLSHTNSDGNSRVASYAVDGTEVDASSREEIFAVDQPFSNHNGGHIVFGPDGKLWLGLGDGGDGWDPENRAQDPGTELGKMIRIDPDTGETEIMVSGVRNPWRYAFDTDGSLWIADVGQATFEEINHLPADQIDGANLGWSGFEGTATFMGPDRQPADAVFPVFEYTHEFDNCSITGGFPYHGDAIAGLQGAFLFADLCAGQIRAITLGDDGTLAREFDLEVNVNGPISFAQDGQGEPYVLSRSGDIVRLLPGS